jgi:hypothetical protein
MRNGSQAIRMPVLVGLATLLLTSAAPFARAADTLIVAGKRVGAVELGMRRAQVEKLLGKAESDHVQSPKRTNSVWSIDDGGGHKIEVRIQFIDGVTTRIGTGAKAYTTSKGLAAGASLASVRALHPQTSESDYFVRRSGGVAVQCHDDVAGGIGFEFDKGAGQDDFVLRAIYVHAPGKPTPCGREDDPHATKKVGAGP